MLLTSDKKQSHLCGLFRKWFIWITAVITVPIASDAQDYPNKPLTMVVPFGVGGSADIMSRMVSIALSKELGQPITVINVQGAGTLLGANYVLSQPNDGYTVLASTFSPYLINTILTGDAQYVLDDFACINFQWFDEDLIALHRGSRFRDLPELLDAIRTKPKTIRASVVRGSAGHLIARLLLEANEIPQESLNLVTYSSGGMARSAVAGGVVDFIIISESGCETIRDYIRPLAIVSNEVNQNWGAPTINQALEPLNVTVPVLAGSVRGFATTAEFKKQFPERFEILVTALRRTLEREDVKVLLDRSDIGRRWTGPLQSDGLLRSNFEVFRGYSFLLDL